jgi:hypothetical protein
MILKDNCGTFIRLTFMSFSRATPVLKLYSGLSALLWQFKRPKITTCKI